MTKQQAADVCHVCGHKLVQHCWDEYPRCVGSTHGLNGEVEKHNSYYMQVLCDTPEERPDLYF